MELTGSTCSEAFAHGDDHGVESSDVLCVLRVDSGGLSLEDLDDRIAQLGRARSMIEGELALALAERAGRSSVRAASAVLRERVLEAAGKAGSDVKLAVSLAESFPATLAALASGEINVGQARVIERVAGKPDYRSEEAILACTKEAPADLLSRFALRREPVEERDYSKYQQQRQDRRLSVTQEPDGSWQLLENADVYTALAGPLAEVGLASPAHHARRPRWRLHWLRITFGTVRGPPHPALARRRTHRHPQPRPTLPRLPPPRPRLQLAGLPRSRLPTPHQRPTRPLPRQRNHHIPTHPTQPGSQKLIAPAGLGKSGWVW